MLSSGSTTGVEPLPEDVKQVSFHTSKALFFFSGTLHLRRPFVRLVFFLSVCFPPFFSARKYGFSTFCEDRESRDEARRALTPTTFCDPLCARFPCKAFSPLYAEDLTPVYEYGRSEGSFSSFRRPVSLPVKSFFQQQARLPLSLSF